MAVRRRVVRKAKVKPEALLAKRVANYIKLKHPDIPFRFDLVDQIGRHNGILNKELHGLKFSKGYPDIIVLRKTKKYGALFIELKATETVPNTQHTRTQALYHETLRQNGYCVNFACGFEEAVEQIEKYMKLKRGKYVKAKSR